MNTHTIGKTAVTTLSGMVGGIGKAVTFTTLTITLEKSFEVAFFAALSATVGYLAKCLLDRLLTHYRRYRIRKNRKP